MKVPHSGRKRLVEAGVERPLFCWARI